MSVDPILTPENKFPLGQRIALPGHFLDPVTREAMRFIGSGDECREAIERILILCPAPLTIQWQDELLRWFGEPFEIIFSAVDQQQLVNPWQRATQVIASLDYAKQDDVRERVWQQRWDLVIVDEAHKCSAYTKRSSGRGDEVEKTRRYQLAERLAADADHLLLLTATPHHGDDDRFSHFVLLIDPDLFPEPARVGERAGEIRRDILSLGEDGH